MLGIAGTEGSSGANGTATPFNQIAMDILKGSLEEISRPASSARSRPGSRACNISVQDRLRVSAACSGSLEVLTAESGGSQDRSSDLEDLLCPPGSSADFSGDELSCESEGANPISAQKTEPPKRQLHLLSEEKVSCILQGVQNPSSNTGSSKPDGSDEENKDPRLQEAIQKMKKLDKILASKVSREREIKKQGKELRIQLWEELQPLLPLKMCILYLYLTPKFLLKNIRGISVRLRKGPHSKDGDPYTLIVSVCLTICTSLAKDAGNAVLMTDDEKRRLAELLKDIGEDGSTNLPSDEVAVLRLSPGEETCGVQAWRRDLWGSGLEKRPVGFRPGEETCGVQAWRRDLWGSGLEKRPVGIRPGEETSGVQAWRRDLWGSDLEKRPVGFRPVRRDRWGSGLEKRPVGLPVRRDLWGSRLLEETCGVQAWRRDLWGSGLEKRPVGFTPVRRDLWGSGLEKRPVGFTPVRRDLWGSRLLEETCRVQAWRRDLWGSGLEKRPVGFRPGEETCGVQAWRRDLWGSDLEKRPVGFRPGEETCGVQAWRRDLWGSGLEKRPVGFRPGEETCGVQTWRRDLWGSDLERYCNTIKYVFFVELVNSVAVWW
ncbi:UNVERIFIED_CONTAM: hypothetical protein FKN15_014276 [Acipenser sinensis]